MSIGDYKNVTMLVDTVGIPTADDGSPMVQLDPQVFRLEYRKKDTVELIGEKILVRQELAKKLILSQDKMQRKYPDWQFLITYGYRAPTVQTKYFSERLAVVVFPC